MTNKHHSSVDNRIGNMKPVKMEINYQPWIRTIGKYILRASSRCVSSHDVIKIITIVYRVCCCEETLQSSKIWWLIFKMQWTTFLKWLTRCWKKTESILDRQDFRSLRYIGPHSTVIYSNYHCSRWIDYN